MVQLRTKNNLTDDEACIIKSKTSSSLLIVLFSASSLILVLSLYNVFFVDKIYDYWPNVIFLLYSIWIVIYLTTTKKAKNSYFLISTALIFVVSVFHLSHIGLYSLGIFDSFQFMSKDMGIWYLRSAWLTLLAISSFGIGVSFTGGVNIYEDSNLKNNLITNYGRSLCWWYGIGFFVVSMMSLLFLFYSVGNIFAYSRTEIFGGIGDTRGFGLFQIFFPTSMILLMLGANSKRQKYIAYLILVVFGLGVLFMGYRSLVMFPLLIGTILWVKSGRKLNKLVIVLGLIFIIVAIPTVRYLRAIGPYSAISSSDISSSINKAKIDDIFIELGATSKVVAYVMKWVPEEENFRYGYTYFLALKNMLPNFSFNINVSKRNLVDNHSLDITNLSASDWFIYRYNRWMFDIGGGAGFSMVAEPYLNFGVSGVVVFFIILGYLLGRLDSVVMVLKPRIFLLSSILIWPLLKSVRNEFSTFLKPSSFILIVFLIWKIITFWKKYKSSQKVK